MLVDPKVYLYVIDKNVNPFVTKEANFTNEEFRKYLKVKNINLQSKKSKTQRSRTHFQE